MLVGTTHWVRTSSVNWDKHKFNCMRQNEKFGVSRQIELSVQFQVDLKLHPLSDCQVVWWSYLGHLSTGSSSQGIVFNFDISLSSWAIEHVLSTQ